MKNVVRDWDLFFFGVVSEFVDGLICFDVFGWLVLELFFFLGGDVFCWNGIYLRDK